MADDHQNATADPVQRLLATSNSIAAWAMETYADGLPTLTTAQRCGVFVWRRHALQALERAAGAVVLHDFGPRVGIGDVECRVQGLVDVCERMISWAIRYRGQQPPPWEPASEEEKYDPASAPLPPGKVMQAEGEHVALWRELAKAQAALKLLLALKLTSDVDDQPKRQDPCDHSRDFSTVLWFGTTYHFTGAQAAIVAILWHEWEKETPDVRHETLLEETGSTAKRFADVFKGNPAWGTLIVQGGTKGTARLGEPKKSL
jgi:hypothetical protein